MQLISIEKDKFLKLLNENHEFRNWIDNQISKNEKISILQKLFEEEFNNNTDKEKLLNQLSDNIRIIDEQIFKDIQAKRIELRDAQIYSISKYPLRTKRIKVFLCIFFNKNNYIHN